MVFILIIIEKEKSRNVLSKNFHYVFSRNTPNNVRSVADKSASVDEFFNCFNTNFFRLIIFVIC